MALELSERFFAKIAGWEAMKQARALLAGEKVLISNWSPPVLKGVVQEGTTSYRAGLAIKDEVDIDNLCTCRASREWGTICAHSVAVGLHHLRGEEKVGRDVPIAPQRLQTPTALQRSTTEGDPAELFLVLPPNLEQAIARGKIMVCFEVKSSRGRTPLNALPKNQPFKFSAQDLTVLDRIEAFAAGQIPAMLMLAPDDFASFLHALTGHPGITLGKNTAVQVSTEPWAPPLRAELQANCEIVLTMAADASSTVLVANFVCQNPTHRLLGIPREHTSVLNGPVRIPRTQVPIFVSRDFPALQV